jgi:hypothetical protein
VEELDLEFGNRRSLPVPGTTSIFLHSRIPNGMMGNCYETRPQKQKEEGEETRRRTIGNSKRISRWGRYVGESLFM